MMPSLYKRLLGRTARKAPSGMAVTQQLFVEWNAERLGISREESAGRYSVSCVYPEPKWISTDPIVRTLVNRYEVSIIDLGCGLAQQSRALAEYLRDATVRVRLTLVDISTVRQEFLLWWGRRAGISTTFLPCALEAPIAELPECDLCRATEFFEQVHDPVAYFNGIDAKLAVGGLLMTGVMDNHRAVSDVSPPLGTLRRRIAECGYETVVHDRILRKR
jgi:Methyltransferase domain